MSIWEMEQKVAVILKYDGYAIRLFEEGKFLRAVNYLLLFDAHTKAAQLRELSKAMTRAKRALVREKLKKEKEETKQQNKRPAAPAVDKRKCPQYRRMMAAYMRWKHHPTIERRNEYEACYAVWRVELHVRSYRRKNETGD